MNKGIKRIYWNESLNKSKGEYIGNKTIKVEAGERITLSIEWFPQTSLEDKQKGVVWRVFNEDKQPISKETHAKYDQNFNLIIPKKYAGDVKFYVEAKWGEKYDFVTGIYLQPKATPKIIKTEWRKVGEEEDSRFFTFKFYEDVVFYAETEGLNECNVTIELFLMYSEITLEKIKHLLTFDHDPLKEDRIFRKYECNVYVNKGIINTAFTILPDEENPYYKESDFAGTKINKNIENRFYVRITNYNSGGYIYDNEKNPSVIHGRFLRVKGEADRFGIPFIENVVNVKPVLIGDSDKNPKEVHTCKFEELSLVDEGVFIPFFNEGSFSKYYKPGGYHDFIIDIYYEFDKYDILPNAAQELDRIALYLINGNAFIPVEIGSHTDVRGSQEYNQILSEKRAQAAVDYLIKKGVNPRFIKAHGYGKSQPIIKDAYTEAEHEKNRRSTLKFLIAENQAKPIIIDTIAPDFTATNKKKIQLRINKWTNEGCTRDHATEIKVVQGLGPTEYYPLKKNQLTIIDQEIHSLEAGILQFALDAIGNNYNNIYKFSLNTCAYYSDPMQETIYINAFTDAVFSTNFAYDIAPIYFNDISHPLYKGTPLLDDFVNKAIEYLKDIGLILPIDRDILKALYEIFISDETKKIATAVFLMANFRDGKNRKQPEKIKNYFREHNVLAEISNIILFVIIQLLIIYITAGLKHILKLKKFKKLKELKQFLEELGFTFISPKVSNYRAIYLDVARGGMKRIFEERVKADPLIAIDYNKKYNLLELYEQDDSLKKLYAKFRETKLEVELNFSSSITMDYKLKVDLNTRQINFIDNEKGSFPNINETIKGTSFSFTPGSMIVGNAKIKADGEVVTDIDFIPFVNPRQYKVTVKVEAELGGYIAFTRNYDFGRGNIPTSQDKIFFSGIKGVIKGNIDTKKKNKGKDWKSIAELEKDIEFTLFKERTFVFKRVPLIV
ncbi:OmpA family protein [Chishuiella sp.]|uniref:OmpA family protein n=1 Tax=Chishuiella sp. TaxID=1969467 RepID=UPI0028B0D9AB|nr:OmpA family protein [Chishuiella sp.]